MKYILKYKKFESSYVKPILLELQNNIDKQLIDEIFSLLPNGGDILEVSCGNGADAIELAENGYNVVATDITPEYVDYVNKQNVKCLLHNTLEKFPFSDSEFDLIYSRLGLHYFNIEDLHKIFDELSRITNKYLIFTVKIVNDNLQTGKIIISKEKWEELVSNKFTIIKSKIHKGQLYNQESEWLEIIAQK